MDINYYNSMVNHGELDPKTNGLNFLSSLEYKESAFKIIDIVKSIEIQNGTSIEILSSFISESLMSEIHTQIELPLSCSEFKCVVLSVIKDVDQVLDSLSENTLIQENCKNIFYDPDIKTLLIEIE